MKKNNILYIFLIFLGCTNPVENLEIGEPFSQSEAILDEWSLVKVKFVDNLEASKPYMDLTSMFTATEAILEVSGTTFSYIQASGPAYLESSGSWSFDDPDFPETVTLGNTMLMLGAPVKPASDSLFLTLERKCEDKVIASYEYIFKRK